MWKRKEINDMSISTDAQNTLVKSVTAFIIIFINLGIGKEILNLIRYKENNVEKKITGIEKY